MPKGYIQN